ncbi:MAG: DinB family protein [Actinomycetota bacterium]
MRTFELDEAIEILRAAPATMRAMLGGLSGPWLETRPNEDAWTPTDIIRHLIVGEETDWIPRARIMLTHGTSKPFDVFDREAQFAAPARPLVEMLDEFQDLRARNLAELGGLALTGPALHAPGIHPEFGEVRLGDMIATWAVHDLSHIAQAAEVMAKRYTEDVGPWRRYLPLLDREELPSS